LLAATAAGACRGQQEQARKQEASALIHAIEQLRSAPNEGKRPQLLALEELPCKGEQLCRLQRVCKRAYQRHLRALESTRSVRHALRTDGGMPDAGTQAAELMSKARQDLERARILTRRCTELQGEVARRFRL
jgi:hypothetical protein